MAFIPLINKKYNLIATESSLKYFLVQALASRIFLLSILIYLTINFSLSSLLLINSALVLKLGAAPLHFWIPSVREGLDWINLIILLVWQKIGPFLILINNFQFYFIVGIIIITSYIGAVGGLNQTSLRKLITYSRINHIGWILTRMCFSKNLWLIYIIFYRIITVIRIWMFNFLNSFYLNQLIFNFNTVLIKFFIFTNFLSLGGLPPFLGFLPKWLVLETRTFRNTILIIFIVIIRIISLNYYLRIRFFSILLGSSKNKWIINFPSINFTFFFFRSFSLTGLILIGWIYSIV